MTIRHNSSSAVIVFHGLCGGVGTTTLAMTVARERGACLLDLDLVHGDAAFRSGAADLRGSIGDLAAIPADELDMRAIEAVSYECPGGISVVPSPAHPEIAELVTARLVERVVELCAAQRPVVIDAGSHILPATIAACAQADEVVLLGRPDSWAERQARIVDDLLERGRVTAQRYVHLGGGRQPSTAWDAGALPHWRQPPPGMALLRRAGLVARVLRPSAGSAHAWSR